MKKLLIASLVVVMLFSGCGKKTMEENTNASPSTDSSQSKREAPEFKTPRMLEYHKDLFAEYSGAILATSFGDIKVKFYAESPITVNSFMNLAQQDFFDNTLFHRVIKDFMVQGGDPNSKNSDWLTHGIGGPDYRFIDEFNAHKLVRGSLAMANQGEDTNGSQFFIVTAEATPWLDGKHTNFGYVEEGMDVMDKIEAVETNERDHPLKDVKIIDVQLIK